MPDRMNNLLLLYCQFFKISAITLGGGLAMVPVMQKEFMERRKLVTESDMLDAVAVVQSLPGILGINMSIMIGHRIAGVPGAVAAAFGTVTPPFIAICIIASVFQNFSGNPHLDHVFRGIRTAVCALILTAAIKMGKTLFKNDMFFGSLVAAASFVALAGFGINPIFAIVAGGAAGLIYSRFRRPAAPKNQPGSES